MYQAYKITYFFFFYTAKTFLCTFGILTFSRRYNFLRLLSIGYSLIIDWPIVKAHLISNIQIQHFFLFIRLKFIDIQQFYLHYITILI